MSHRNPRTLPFPAAQPEPTRTYVSYVGGTTAIVRVWRPGEAARCRLCPAGECSYDTEDRLCLVSIAQVIPRSTAPSFRLASPPAPRGRGRDGLAG